MMPQMRTAKRDRLQQAGWRIGSAQDFLGLSDDETALIEMRLALGRSLKERRLAAGHNVRGQTPAHGRDSRPGDQRPLAPDLT